MISRTSAKIPEKIKAITTITTDRNLVNAFIKYCRAGIHSLSQHLEKIC
jgi:hypothetical protein